MARPKLGEGETERLHMKLSAEERDVIDDWRYKNRVPSRSEAVRRLCQIGIKGEGHVDQLIADMVDLLGTMSVLRSKLIPFENEQLNKLLDEVLADHHKVSQDIQLMAAAFSKIANAEDLQQLMEQTKEAMKAPKPASS
ncbi:hypothetical protein AB9F46_31445 [Rhizobium leguminosarum]|uniref:hypothetical protein n=1 Tax=Rhizobium leguminosarum TaxID=384 RepID=UPI003F9C46CE